MEIIIVRHAEPNYTIDSLTAKGKHEAKLLSDRLIKENIDFFYCSPLGRAKKTASYTLKRLTKPCETLDWLREFEGKITEDGKETHCWDRLPSVWTADERHYTSLWNTTGFQKALTIFLQSTGMFTKEIFSEQYVPAVIKLFCSAILL